MDMWISQYELDTLLGKDAAKLLCSHYGGVRFYIPTVNTVATNHPFAMLLGMRAMRALASAYGGNRITVPNGRNEPKKSEILDMLEQGKGARATALALGVTERWVSAVAQQHAVSTRQLALPLEGVING